MLHKPSAVFNDLLDYISSLRVIDCHEHMAGPQYMRHWREPITALTADYMMDDLVSAGADARTVAILQDEDVPTPEKWKLFEPLWRRTEFTAYARVTRLIMRDVYGVNEMSLDGLARVADQLAKRDEAFYNAQLDDAGIRLILADALGWEPGDFGAFLRGEQVFPDRWRMLVPLPVFHVVRHHAMSARDWAGVQRIGAWADRHITSLDEFLEAVFIVLEKAKARGAIGLKDQCAYNRSLDYDVTPRSDAERIFNRMLSDPRTVFGWSDAKPLDDFLFHQYMRFARDLALPVQIHTGHMAGSYNRVDRASVRLFASVMELHQEVKFDLFHGSYPYDDDILFFLKNYPNVRLNLCWMFIIDPLKAAELLKRATVTAPHSKVHGFGGDYVDHPEYSVASLKIARHVMASALTDLVEQGWLDEGDARRIAAAWLFHNPGEFFNLTNTEKID